MSAAFEKRVAALEATRRVKWVAVPSPAGPLTELVAVLEAWRDGRPFEHLPLGHPVDLLLPDTPAEPTALDAFDAPGSLLLRQMESLRKALAGSNDATDFDEIRKATVRAIEAEARDSARRERQRLKRLRKKERRQAAA